MKPQKRTMTVEYWTCRKPEHRHRSEQAALNCLAIYKGTGPKGKRVFSDEEIREIVRTEKDFQNKKISRTAMLKKFGISIGQLDRAKFEFGKVAIKDYPDEFLNYSRERLKQDQESASKPPLIVHGFAIAAGKQPRVRLLGTDVYFYATEVVLGNLDPPKGVYRKHLARLVEFQKTIFGNHRGYDPRD